MERQYFYGELTNCLIRLNPEAGIKEIDENANLQELGLVDSLNMVQMILFLEEILGEDIRIEKYSLRDFYTLKNVYEKVCLPVLEERGQVQK
ncbi:acyl carrier protein [Paenibacillus sp. DYY-L-2]|uniref:acyl carrier protein n=1 Tax=Paenibacillus sp. DYY-L-2 TaxID=3447013 RepID=UPI003F500EED